MEETLLLNLEVDQSDAQKQLTRTEKTIISLKKEQADLNKEYKAGKITEDQYVQSNLKLQRALKNESDQKRTLNKLLDTESNSRNAIRARVSQLNKEYNNLNITTDIGKKRADELQKELSQLNEELNKGSKAAGQFKDNIGNYPEQFSAAVDQVKPFGVSVSDAGTSMTKFLNPATAAVGILGGLAAAYLRSSSGAKDLTFAQDRLSFVTDSLIESLGTLAGGEGEGGEGVINRLLDGVIRLGRDIPGVSLALLALQKTTGFSIEAVEAQANAFAKAREELRKLEIEAARAQGFAKFFEAAAENARRVRDDEEAILEERLRSSNAVEQNLLANQTVRLNVLNQEIAAIKTANVNWKNQDAIVLQIEQKRAEVRDIEEEINGKLTENFNARKAILQQIGDLERANRRAANVTPDQAVEDPLQGAFATQLDVEESAQKDFNKRIAKLRKDQSDEAIRQKNREVKARLELEKFVQEEQLNITSGFLSAAASLFDQQSEEFRALATFQTLISTYSTAQKAYEAAFVPPTVASPALGAANVALAIAQGLANVAAINGIQFAEGGYTGSGGKYEPAGVVHKGEVVWSQQDVASVGGPSIANAMRPTALRGYADGGFVTSQNISATQQALIMANAVKNLPAPVVGVREFTRVARQVEVREQAAKI